MKIAYYFTHYSSSFSKFTSNDKSCSPHCIWVFICTVYFFQVIVHLLWLHLGDTFSINCLFCEWKWIWDLGLQGEMHSIWGFITRWPFKNARVILFLKLGWGGQSFWLSVVFRGFPKNLRWYLSTLILTQDCVKWTCPHFLFKQLIWVVLPKI